MDFHPPLIIFLALGAGAMALSAVLAIAIEKVDNWLTQEKKLSRPVKHHGRIKVAH
jgi:hypothetical protein